MKKTLEVTWNFINSTGRFAKSKNIFYERIKKDSESKRDVHKIINDMLADESIDTIEGYKKFIESKIKRRKYVFHLFLSLMKEDKIFALRKLHTKY